MPGFAKTATAFPGATGQRLNNIATLAEMLRLNGYSTAQFGKNHETAPWEVNPYDATDRRPTGQSFDKFYGFMGGETNQWALLIYGRMTQVYTFADAKAPSRHITQYFEILGNRAIY